MICEEEDQCSGPYNDLMSKRKPLSSNRTTPRHGRAVAKRNFLFVEVDLFDVILAKGGQGFARTFTRKYGNSNSSAKFVKLTINLLASKIIFTKKGL